MLHLWIDGPSRNTCHYMLQTSSHRGKLTWFPVKLDCFKEFLDNIVEKLILVRQVKHDAIHGKTYSWFIGRSPYNHLLAPTWKKLMSLCKIFSSQLSKNFKEMNGRKGHLTIDLLLQATKTLSLFCFGDFHKPCWKFTHIVSPLTQPRDLDRTYSISQNLTLESQSKKLNPITKYH